jgi:voltage-gated potassium channel
MSDSNNHRKDGDSFWIRFKFGPLSTRLTVLMRHRNFPALLRFVLILTGLVTSYSVLFQLLMAYEGQQHSIVTGFYWTFSIVVLLSGIVFMLVLLPFTFIELFYEPWMEARAANLIPRSVPEGMNDHVILTFYGPVAAALIEKLGQYNYPYVVVLPEVEQVTLLGDAGINCILGELNDPKTWEQARVEHAALVATTRDDITNTSVVFTVRGITDRTPVVATARSEDSVEILKLAGCSRVLDLTRLVAEALARRVSGGSRISHVIGKIDDLLIAEVDSGRTSLVGKGYTEAQRLTSVSIVGFWARGVFEIGQPESVVGENTLLLMAGSRDQLKEFDTTFQSESALPPMTPVIIIGGGRVGRASAAALKRRGVEYRVVEQAEERVLDPETYIHGSAGDKSVLQLAGIESAQTVIITTGDDETNIYLTIFCRLLRPDIQVICRATLERNVAAMHRAGCDIALSYASLGANALFNLLHRVDLLMVAEGLDVFKVPVPGELAGKTLSEADFRQRTNCSVIGIDSDDKTTTNPGPDSVLPEGGEIVLIGTPQSETEFLKRYPTSKA